MGISGANGNNKNDPLWIAAFAEASKLDADDGNKNEWIGKTIWDKHFKEYGDKQRPKGISVSNAAQIIYEKKLLKSLDFSKDIGTFDDIKAPEDEIKQKPFEDEVPQKREVTINNTFQKKADDTSSKHSIGVYFHKILGKDILEKDENTELKISYDKVKEKINNADIETLKDIAASLGVNTRFQNSNEDYPVNIIKQYINRSIDILKEADKNKDMYISDYELEQFDRTNSNSYSNFSEAGKTVGKKTRLYEILGITDGKYNNEQGQIGDCWLLGVGQSLTDNPEVYNKIFKKDDNGVTITFYGVKGKNGKPFAKRITNQEIQKQHKANILAKNNGAEKYGSNDPDAIALEIAMPSAISQWNSNMEVYKNYIANSTMKEFQKPDISKLSKTMDRKTFSDILNYLDNADKYNKAVYNRIESIAQSCEESKHIDGDTITIPDEEFEKLKNFIENQPQIEASKIIKMDQEKEYDNKTKKLKKNIVNSHQIKRYLAYSYPTSDNVKKPEMPQGYVGTLINDLDGGRPEIALQFLTGAMSSNSTFVSKDSPSSLLKQDEFEKYKENKRISVNFFEDHAERGIYGQHEYYIKLIEGNKVILGDSHDSTRTHTATIKEIEKWSASLTPTDLSEINI